MMKRQVCLMLLLWSYGLIHAQQRLQSDGDLYLFSQAHLWVGGSVEASQRMDVDGAISVTGNWSNSLGFEFLGHGTLSFVGPLPQMIDAQGTSFPVLCIDNSQNLFADSSKLVIRDSLKLLAGHLVLQDQLLELLPAGAIAGASPDRFIVTNGDGGVQQSVSGLVKFPIGPLPSTYAPCEIDNGNQATEVVVRCFEHVYQPPISGNILTDSVVDQTWVIEPGQGAFNGDVTCYWDSAQALPGFDPNACGVARAMGNGTWEMQTLGNAGQSLNGLYHKSFQGLQDSDSLMISSSKALSVDLKPPFHPLSFQCSPIPSSGPVKVAVSSEEWGRFKLRLLSMEGRMIKEWEKEKSGPVMETLLNLEKQGAGAYLLEITSPSGQFSVAKILIQPK